MTAPSMHGLVVCGSIASIVGVVRSADGLFVLGGGGSVDLPIIKGGSVKEFLYPSRPFYLYVWHYTSLHSCPFLMSVFY